MRPLSVVVIAIASLIVLTGCTAVFDDPGSRTTDTEDGLGVENGVAYDDSLSVDASDGLDERELNAVTSRMMARIEQVRGLEFQETVPVTTISREEYRERSGNRTGEGDRRWREQFWEATFIVDEETTVGEARGGVFGTTVQGYYNGSHIVIVGAEPNSRLPDRTTIVHELQHALQDQHAMLPGGGETHDEGLAIDGVVEGDANYVEQRYEQRCEGDWSCISKPEPSGNGTGPSYNLGLFVAVFNPYADGPTLITDLRDRDGWPTVNDALQSPPRSTEQVIHPSAYPDETPMTVDIEDRSSGSWDRFETDDGHRRDTVGEATLYAGFWSNGVIDRDHLRTEDSTLSPYNYDHPISAGWGGDRIVPYTNGSAHGYVFASTWDTERDARQFHDGYLELLRTQDAETVAPGVYRVPESSSFADAFRVVQNGTRVTVVNAPTVAELEAVHDPADDAGRPRSEESTDPRPIPIPGFGVGLGILSVIAAVAMFAVQRVG